MVAFYNQADQDIYNSGSKFVPQERYRLGYTPPVQGGGQDASTPSFGIPNTNAFTNSGGGNFNSAGNAFGYGSPVQEVNVRTFNPQSNDPTGSVANAQGIYNQSAQALESGYSPSYTDGSMAGKSLSDIQSMANNQIMDNREQYGAQGQYNSPYDDTVDLGFRGRDTSTSLEGRIGKDGIRRRSGLAKAIDFVTDYFPGIGAVKRGAKFIGGLLPDNPNGPGGGSYGVAGLSNAQKEQYNALANKGMLFDGPSGMKTSTGKNFTGKGYMEGQIDLAKGFGFDTMTDQEIEDDLEESKNNKNKQFEYRQKIEAWENLQTNKIQQEKQKAEDAKNRAETAAIQTRVDRQYEANKARDGRDFSVRGDDTPGNPTGKSNQASSERGYAMHGADGGRAGYFFGGRVNFKNGGLASIL